MSAHLPRHRTSASQNAASADSATAQSICDAVKVTARLRDLSIQEKAYGGLSRATQRLLDQLVKQALTKPNGRLQLPRRIKPGSELVRRWKGKSYRVTVVADGFAYDGKTFSNLSEIATTITGTRWNGPRFFGLRSSSSEADANGR